MRRARLIPQPIENPAPKGVARPARLRALATCLLLTVALAPHAGADWWQDSNLPESSAFWWPLSEAVTPAALRQQLLDPVANAERYQTAAGASAGAETPEGLALFVSGDSRPELVPAWLALRAFASVVSESPQAEDQAISGLLAHGVSHEGMEQVFAAAHAIHLDELQLQAEVEGPAEKLSSLVETAAESLGEDDAYRAVRERDAAALAAAGKLPEPEVESLLAAALRSPTVEVVLPVLENLDKALGVEDRRALHDYFRSEIVPGTQILAVGNRHGNGTVAIGWMSYLVNALPSNPDVIVVRTAATAVYEGILDPSDRYWSIECFVQDDLSNRYGDFQATTAPILPTRRLSCEPGGGAIPKCKPGTSLAFGYQGIATAVIYHPGWPGGPGLETAQAALPWQNTVCEHNYSVGGTVTGLRAGDYLSLRGTWVGNGGGGSFDNQTVTSDHSFALWPPIPDGASYDVDAITPGGGALSCEVTNGSGIIRGFDVTNVRVSCECDSAVGSCAGGYSVGGSVTGVAEGEILGLQLEGTAPGQPGVTDYLALRDSGTFQFDEMVPDGGTYSVGVTLLPAPEKTCSVSNGSGTIDGQPVTDVLIACTCQNGSTDCDDPRNLELLRPFVPRGDSDEGICHPVLNLCTEIAQLPWFFEIVNDSCERQTVCEDGPTECVTVCEGDPPSCETVCSSTLICRDGCAAASAAGLVLAGPTVAIAAPRDGELVSGPVQVEGFAADFQGVAGIVFFLDHEEITLDAYATGLHDPLACQPPIDFPGCDPNAGFSGQLDTSNLGDGEHVLHAVAIDANGGQRMATVFERRFVFSGGCASGAPSAELVSPSGPSPVGGAVQLAADAMDDGSIVAVDFLVDGSVIGRDTNPDPATGRYTLEWNTDGLYGEHAVAALAIDDCGQTGRSDTVSVSIDNGLRVEVSATGQVVGQGESFVFPAVPVDDLPISRLFTLCNHSLETATLFEPGLVSGTGFSQIGTPPSQSLQSGECTNFRARLQVASPGDYAGSVAIEHSLLGSPFTFLLEAEVLAGDQPEIEVSVAATGQALPNDGYFGFPDSPLATLPISRLFEVCNNGHADLTIDQPTSLLAGSGFSQIAPWPDPVVEPGACTAFRIRFQTTGAGHWTGGVTLANNDRDESPYRFSLSGVAVSAATPDLRIESGTGEPLPTGGSFSFPALPPTELPISRLFRVCNDGDGDLVLAAPLGLVTGPGFSQIPTWPSPIVAPGSCTDFRVRFLQAQTGTFVGSLGIASNDPDEDPYEVELLATALPGPAPEIRVVQASNGLSLADGGGFELPATSVVDLPISRLFEICNDGDGDLELDNPQALVAGPGFSQIAPFPDAQIAPGSCTAFRVRFLIANPGSYPGAIAIGNNDSNEDPFDLQLAATALAAAPAEIHLEQAWDGALVPAGGSLVFPETSAGQAVSRLFRICNSGPGDLIVGNASTLLSGAGFTQIGSPPDSVVPSGECQAFRVRFQPAAAGAHQGAITVRSNDLDEDPYAIEISGTAVP